MRASSSSPLDPFIQAVLGKKAMDIVILKMSDLTSFADYFIICSGNSHRQVAAIAEHIQMELKKTGLRLLSQEGKEQGHWILMDYGDVVIHIFYEPVRQFYDLEGLWIDAKRISIGAIETNNHTGGKK